MVQLLRVALSGWESSLTPDLNTVLQDEEQQGPAQWASVCGGFAGRVVGLDAATHLPLLLAASKDGWVRVWDWMRRQQLAARQLEGEQPLCCALHPSGLLAAVGTAEVLRVFWVLRVSRAEWCQALMMQGAAVTELTHQCCPCICRAGAGRAVTRGRVACGALQPGTLQPRRRPAGCRWPQQRHHPLPLVLW